MRVILTVAFATTLLASVHADQLGRVGVYVGSETDFRVITDVVPDSPAARAGIQPGDRVLAVDGYQTSQLHSAKELAARGSGDAGTELELQLERPGVAQPFRVRMRRALAPQPNAKPTAIPDISGYQASSRNGLTRRCT